MTEPSSELRRGAPGRHRECHLDRQRPTERSLTELPEGTLAELGQRVDAELAEWADPEMLSAERRLTWPAAETLTDHYLMSALPPKADIAGR